MAVARSFAEYVKSKCYNSLYQAAEVFLSNHWESLNLYTRKVRKIASVELTDATIQRVYIEDMPAMLVGFDVCMELEICVHEGNYRYDETDVCYPWVRLCCEGDLSYGLDGFTIKRIMPYSKKNAPLNSLSDALVPNIKYSQLEKIAYEFLAEYYPEALKVTRYGEPPIPVNPVKLADKLGLSIIRHRIREDGSIYGQIYFADSNVDMFDEETDSNQNVFVPKNTIVVDPHTCLFRSLGCENNTIVHECIHSVKHRKVFELERLYNTSAYGISCEVVGGAESAVLRTATETMEKQANQLAPRIQMPEGPFRAKASEYIGRFMLEKNTKYPHEVMEAVIIQLQQDFLVSRQAAKIRMIELGFDEAIGTYTYLDGHWVKPHGFKKDSLKWNQTFSVSAQDAGYIRFVNKDLRALTAEGDYLFVDNHFVFNDPLYVQYDENGHLGLTPYALSHMDECCLIFTMAITSGLDSVYHTACFFNRVDADYRYGIEWYGNLKDKTPEERLLARKRQKADEANIRKKMTDDPGGCLRLLLDWCGKTQYQLARETGINVKTLKRIDYGETKPQLGTALLICFGLHLPPVISRKLLETFGCPIKGVNQLELWIDEALACKYMEEIEDVREYLKTNAGYDLPDRIDAEKIIDGKRKSEKARTRDVQM